MKIRWRLAWYGVGLTAAVLLLFNLLIAALLVGSSGDDQDRLLSSTAEAAVEAISAVDVEATEGGDALFLPDATTSDQPFTTVYDDLGTPIYATATVGGALLDLPAAVVVEALEEGNSEITTDGVRSQIRHWTDASGTEGVVAASQATRVVDQQTEGARGFLLVFAVIALIATLVGAWFMSGRALRPVNLLASTTDEIERTGDLSRRLEPVDRDDEIGALTASFNGMLDSIEEATRQRDATIAGQRQFVADASHELRSPLTSILANAGFLVDRPDADASDRDDAMHDIRSEAVRMGELVDRLLVLARADLDAASTRNRGPVDLSAIAASVARRARNLDVEVSVHSDGAVVVTGDASELAEMIWILIDNADRHGGSTVSVSVVNTGTEAQVVVTDDGDGIADEDLKRVFDRFHRGDAARSGEGYGLGLSIARSVAESHGGSVRATNGDGVGAVFVIALPMS